MVMLNKLPFLATIRNTLVKDIGFASPLTFLANCQFGYIRLNSYLAIYSVYLITLLPAQSIILFFTWFCNFRLLLIFIGLFVLHCYTLVIAHTPLYT